MPRRRRSTRDGDRLIDRDQGEGDAGAARSRACCAIGAGQGLASRRCPARWRRPRPTRRRGWLAALLAFAGAVLGGLLLNVMPCVFPILSLKALSLARVGADERAARREALAYTAAWCWCAWRWAALILALRAGGSGGRLGVPAAGSARDRRAAAAADAAIALNLAGLFEIADAARSPAQRRGGRRVRDRRAGGVRRDAVHRAVHGRGAGRGAGAAWPAALAVFAGLGLGLALPFLAIGFVPALRRRLPKPGAWMETFRHILAVPMFLTALALAWVLGRQAGVDGMTLGLVAALLRRRWCCGGRPAPARGQRRGWCAGALALRRWSSARGARHAARRGRGAGDAPAASRSPRRGSPRCAPGAPGVRLFHRRLVPDVQGQREGGDRDRGGRATRSRKRQGRGAGRRLDRRRSRRSAASSKAHNRAGVPLYL